MTVEVKIAALAALAGGLLAVGGWIVLSTRPSPQERERQRRFALNQRGRIAHGVLTAGDENVLHYRYEVNGVSYSTAQDISMLREYLPTDPQRLIGPVTLKYSPKNPANSIVVCESWSGLRVRTVQRL
ncbi:MAG TPA: hypothetical protein VFA28_08495 [Bryobacteraceae bacterium]|jgi:hypothetical protein|nr:hypothetical protein [Bryobacteraceae bacterium]